MILFPFRSSRYIIDTGDSVIVIGGIVVYTATLLNCRFCPQSQNDEQFEIYLSRSCARRIFSKLS